MPQQLLSALNAHTVLIVDDTPSNLALLVGMLEQRGLRLVVAQDGEEALRRVPFASPDLILLDVMLPGMDGFAVCRQLKAMPAPFNAIPVIFMTALGGSADKVAGFAAGGVDYVTKPLQMDEVLARVATHLRHASMQRQLAEQNTLLAEENAQRRAAQQALQQYRAGLEAQVAARTAQLHESERQFRTLCENSPDAIARYDRRLRRVYVNPAYLDATGLSEEEALARPLGYLWRATQPVAGYEATLRKVLADGEPASLELTFSQREPVGDVAIRMVAERGPDGGITGVLAIARDVTALKQAEREVAASYAQLRELAAHREGAREDERKRIARELHDELGQCLTALRMSTGLLRVRFGAATPGLSEHVASMTAMVDDTLAVVRHVAAMLRPPALDLGLGSALEWLATEIKRHHGVRCQLRMELDDAELDEEVATALFRVVQESLTNVARHAHVGEVAVTLRRHDDRCLLQVRDRGRGFNPRQVPRQSFGLLGIRERVHGLGGELVLQSAPGSGTRLQVSLPLRIAAPD